MSKLFPIGFIIMTMFGERGLISPRTAVKLLGITDKPDEEVDQILKESETKNTKTRQKNTVEREKSQVFIIFVSEK